MFGVVSYLCYLCKVMAGIYVHIPFCKSRCIYCGFFSTTALDRLHAYVNAVVEELYARRDFLRGEPIETIYFGGGTPSLLPVEEMERILSAILYIYNVRDGAEITLEGNPDDISPALLTEWRRIGFNRLSMGVQTFSDVRLQFLHRRHTAEQAVRAIQDAQQAGFENLSVDLMFGFPGQTLTEWTRDVERALSLRVPHLSAYSLMYEEGTCLNRMLERGDVVELDEEVALDMYESLIDMLEGAGYRHYELSNFALPGWESRHNSSYWHGIPYLGVGAGAHAYDGVNRYFHADSLDEYLSGTPCVREELSEEERYNEYVFTGLRTAEGIQLSDLERKFGSRMKDFCLCNAKRHIDDGRLCFQDENLRLSRKGLFVSNDVMSDLMWTEAERT